MKKHLEVGAKSGREEESRSSNFESEYASHNQSPAIADSDKIDATIPYPGSNESSPATSPRYFQIQFFLLRVSSLKQYHYQTKSTLQLSHAIMQPMSRNLMKKGGLQEKKDIAFDPHPRSTFPLLLEERTQGREIRPFTFS